ncbi:lysophospholipid acyltransferase family protein [Govanella unica]|uniref:1-acyl-sn-glycerol-3-phosphate acyltransferase n=1 Tax=Govanella unica TaxID=2975056 RepID=A0A9X3Z660_9PROT|nr:lysophospholipid acyltransferase family protein [Govania unica]MDA5192604.1 1-acyl-sn-glycerol-3-phosphate acyltransferase [Govania unica]
MTSAMDRIRIFLFTISLYLWTLIIGGIIGWPALFLPRGYAIFIQTSWGRGTIFLLRVLCGIRFEVRGLDRVPEGAVLIASKHQSAWDTFIFLLHFKAPTFIFKKELLRIPIYGWICLKTGMVPIDRQGGAAALKAMLRGAAERIGEGRSIVIFPEGTRVKPGSKMPYNPGVAGLYKHLGVPVVPVALNSGMVWPKGGVIRTDAMIRLEYLEPILPGSDKASFLTTLESRIEDASLRLLAEGVDR